MIHPLADVNTSDIGANTTIWQFAIILADAKIGSNCNINSHTFIERKVVIGDNVTIKCGVYLWDGIRLEDNVFIGPNVTFINDPYPRSKKYLTEYPTTFIMEGVSIGANATIKCGLTIGEFAMIGAASMVTKNIKSHELWFGNPAKHKGYVTREGVVLDMNLKDKKGNKYYLSTNGEPVLKETT